MIDLYFLVFLCILIICGSRRLKENTELLSIGSSNYMKGICALIIYFHHLSQRCGGIIFSKVGYLAVAVFFFLSGYGICRSYIWDKSYIKKIVKIKIPVLVAWSVLFLIVNSAVYYLIAPPITITMIFNNVSGGVLLNWYFPAIIIKYILFVLSVKISKGNHEKLTLISFLFLTFYVSFWGVFFYHDIFRWASSYAFEIGILLAIYERKINEGLKMINKNTFTIIFFLCFIPLFLYANYIKLPHKSIWALMRMPCYIISAILFCVIFFLLARKAEGKGIITRLGKNSGVMILVQTISLSLPRSNVMYIESSVIYCIVSLVVQSFLVLFFAPILAWIEDRIGKN